MRTKFDQNCNSTQGGEGQSPSQSLRKLDIIMKKILLILVILCCSNIAHAAEKREIIGRVEYAILQDYRIKYKARIDTGAGVSSLDAKVLEIQKSKNKTKPDRVIFEIYDEEGKPKRLNLPIVEWQNIKKKGLVGFSKRPVVMLDVCLGGRQIEARVNLEDRHQFLYPFLVGRNMLKAGDFLIDPSQTYMEHPACKF
jgi:hypothetical protein